MMEIKNNTILIVSNDITINESLTEVFNSYDIAHFSNENSSNYNFKSYSLVVLDDFNIDKNTLEKILDNNNVINISNKHYDNIINIERPFSLRNLFSTINDFLSKKNKIMDFKGFFIENNILKIGSSEIKFGNKEISLIKYLFDNCSASKNDLLKDIWGYNEEMETKVLENTINKIKQKNKEIEKVMKMKKKLQSKEK